MDVSREDLELADLNGNTLLHNSCIYNIKETIEIICSYGINLNIPNNDGNTPLHLACIANNSIIVEMLCSYGAKLDISNKDGRTPMDIARGNSEVTKILEKYNTLSLKVACYNNDTELVRKLINTGIDVNIVDSLNFCALHYACYNGNMEIVKLLIENGATMDTKSKKTGDTPLHTAYYKGWYEIVHYLIKNGGDKLTNCKNNYKLIPEKVFEHGGKIITRYTENMKKLEQNIDTLLEMTNKSV